VAGWSSHVAEVATAGDCTITTGGYASKGYSDVIVSRVRRSGRSKGQSGVDSYRHASRSGHTESISDSNSGIEWSTSDVSVTCRAYVSGATITKGPAACRCTNTTGCRSGKVDQSTNLCQIMTRTRSNSSLRLDGYWVTI